MKKLEKKSLLPEQISKINDSISLKGFIDTHIHTSPDIKPRILNDLEAAHKAKTEGMQAIVIKCHVEPTSGRALIAKNAMNIDVFGGICLNKSVGGFNPDAVEVTANMGGKFVWFPTISVREMRNNLMNNNNNNYNNYISYNNSADNNASITPKNVNISQKSNFGIFDPDYEELIESILHIIAQNDMVLATGHLNPFEIFELIDFAKSCGVKRILINHPLTGVVGATMEEQKEMAKNAFLEQCFVACMPMHDNLNPDVMAETIDYVGSKKCIMATDFGQKHNLTPIKGFKLFIKYLMDRGISEKHINIMCSLNPRDLIY
jgi:hypothetical protein